MWWSSDSEDAGSTAAEIERSFSSSQLWEFEMFLGNGSYGVVVLLRDKDPLLPFDQTRIVLKQPIVAGRGVDELRREIQALERLRGSFHIAQLLASCDDVAAANSSRVSGFRTLGTPFSTVFDILRKSRVKGPAMLLEYLENGSLSNLAQRVAVVRGLQGRRIILPNRLLWSFYFCLVRACVGMAYPPEAPESSPLVLETIPPNRQRYGLVHGDIAFRNIMVGDRDPAGPPEHHLAPQLKLIDFGCMRVSGDGSEAVTENIADISSEVVDLVCLNSGVNTMSINYAQFNGIRTMASAIVPVPGTDPFPHLDHELRDLLIRGCAVSRGNRPSLQEMLRRTEQGMKKPASSYPGQEIAESDDSIEELIQTLVFNA
ncbi:kinase-like domain-containing protein [Xylaria cf. heliscus]|nr:kinase-like domain-containing protein [Xylaria cf. heliscus]